MTIQRGIPGAGARRVRISSAARPGALVACLLVTLLVAGCGGDKGKSSSGGGGSTATPSSATPAVTSPGGPTGGTAGSGQPAPQQPAKVVGPNLNGNWAGYYKSIEGHYQNLSATITHVGNRVTIETTMPPGIVNKLVGQIDGAGNMLLYDQFDNEDWTTLYGPASSNSINLADYVFINQSLSDTNIVILKR